MVNYENNSGTHMGSVEWRWEYGGSLSGSSISDPGHQIITKL